MSALAQQIRAARSLARKGKGAKTIARRVGMDIESARSVVKAVKEVRQRTSQKDRLEGMVSNLENLIPQAVRTYKSRPSGYHATALTTLTMEVRQMMKDIKKLNKPEQQAVDIIRKVMQPLLRKILRDYTKHLVRAREKCLAVSTSQQQERAVNDAFKELGLNLGVLTDNHYRGSVEEIAVTMECDIDEMKRLASGVSDPSDADEDERGMGKVVHMDSRWHSKNRRG